MTSPETNHDLWLKRAQIIIGILAGLATLLIGVHNVKQNFFPEIVKGALSVVVRTENGAPIVGANVAFYTADNILIAAGGSDQSAEFSKKDLQVGAYLVKVTAQGFEPEVLNVRVEAKKNNEFQVMLRALPQLKQEVVASKTPSAIQSALDEVGASWIKKIASSKSEAKEQSAQ